MDSFKRFITHQFRKGDVEEVAKAFQSPDLPLSIKHEIDKQWKNQDDIKDAGEIDFNGILSRIHHRINLKEAGAKDSTLSLGSRRWSLVGKAAAILLLPLLMASVWASMYYSRVVSRDQMFVVSAPKGQQSKIVLNDGSEVWLNSESTLTYSSAFGTDNRNLRLTGEGFFKVAKNKKVPFVVAASDIEVTAVGTSFNIDECKKHSTICVTLVEGKVKVAKGQQTQMMEPGEQLLVDRDGKMALNKVDTEMFTSWHQGILVFKNEVLENITRQLEKRYDVTFEYKDEALRQFRYRGRLHLDYSILKSLEILKISTGLKYEIKGRVIILKNE